MKFRLLLLLIFSFTLPVSAQKNQIKVEVNKNIEFVAFLCWLTDYGVNFESGSNQLQWQNQAFQLATYKKFKAYKDDPVLDLFKTIDQNEGLSSYIWLVAPLDDFPYAKLHDGVDQANYISTDDALVVEEKRRITEKVLADLNQFYRKIKFDQFLNENDVLYQRIIREVTLQLPDERFLAEMESFYGQYDKKGFVLTPSLLIPSGMGFGPTLNQIVYAIFGSFGGIDIANNRTNFDNQAAVLTYTTHEFGHSFVNHMVDQVSARLIEDTHFLFEPIKTDMKKQGYDDWKTVLYEHFVRAGEIIIASNLGNPSGSEQLYEWHVHQKKFIYLPIILEHLQTYQTNKTSMTYLEGVEQALSGLIKAKKL